MRLLCLLLWLAVSRAPLAAQEPHLALDHLWLVVSPGAPERVALERAGLSVAPGVNRHESQGTASITVEFENAFLELIWVDSSVRIAPGLEIVQARFRNRSNWRISKWSPVGVAFHRTEATQPRLPFSTWRVTAPWMESDDYMEMLTPRGDSLVTAWIVGKSDIASEEGARALVNRDHRIGVRRVSNLRVTGPGASHGPPIAYLNGLGSATFQEGAAWLVELTFDQGAAGQVRDLRPALPLVLRW